MSSAGGLAEEKKRGPLQKMVATVRRATIKPEVNPSMQLEEIGKASASGTFTPLLTMHQAAREGNVEMMERLLERIPQLQVRKKRLNQCDESKLAPIHYAARYNHRHMVEYLIKKGANVQEKAEDDNTALHLIAKYKPKSSLNSIDTAEKEVTRLENEKESEQLSCVELLVSSGAYVNAKDSAGQTPLHLACERENITIVKQLLKCPVLALETANHHGLTALHIACLNGHSNIVGILVEAGADLRCRDKEMMTPMHLACSEGYIEIAQILFQEAEKREIKLSRSNSEESVNEARSTHKATFAALQPVTIFHKDIHRDLLTKIKDLTGGVVLLLDEDGAKSLPLHLAIEKGHLSLVEFSIEKTKAAGRGSMVNSLQSNSNSCLHLAVESNSIEIVKLLLKEGVDINARNSSMVSPLYIACQHNAHVVVKHLLESGCDIETKDTHHMTPFLVASRYGHLKTLALLMEYNADVTATDKDDKTCLMLAAEEDRAEAIQLMINNNKIKFSIEESDKYNNTALHLASMKGHSVTVKLLLDYQASAESKNDADQNTLHMAALHGHYSIIPDLVNRDRSIINAGDDEANTVLHLAAIGGNIKCVNTLIELGANLSLRNVKQWTPLDCACAFGFVKPARALLEAGAAIEPSGKIKISPLHLACQRGHVEVVDLLLEWKVDVTFLSIDGRNALDFAIDFGQRNCVLSLIKHPTWQDSLRNAYIYPVTGRLITPMRKLIMKMEDMAEIVCNQCIENNGKQIDDESLEITLLYELLDDMYSSCRWMGNNDRGTTHKLVDEDYKAFDESGHVTKDAYSYYDDSDILQKNHPLMLMVQSKCVVLLKHPVVVCLLDYKWQRFGRYVYYTSLIFFLLYLVLLNVLMMEMPRFYEIDWVKMLQVRKIKAGLQFTTSPQIATNDSINCFYYRAELSTLPNYAKETECVIMYPLVVQLRWAVLILSVLNLIREILQCIRQRLAYLNVINVITVILYLFTFFLNVNFMPYQLGNLAKLTNGVANNSDLIYLESVQKDTGLWHEWQQDIGAFSVFLSWMVLLLYIRKFPMFGIFVVMFTDVLKIFARFSAVLLFFILSFALTFNVLLGNQYFFDHWFWSATTTVAMMVGEINYETIFFTVTDPESVNYCDMAYTKGISVIILVIAIVVMTMIIMNLLVGLAVGDIMEVQENASLQRFRMQVDLALEVEFSLPKFLRKKLWLGKQNIQINKYKKANLLTKFLFENHALTKEHISKYLDKEVVEQNYEFTDMDAMVVCLDHLRNRVSDLLFDISDIKQDIRDVGGKVTQARMEAQMITKDIKVNVVSTSNELSERIQQTHKDRIEKTHLESNQTRDEMDETKQGVESLLEEVERSRREALDSFAVAEQRVTSHQEILLHRQEKDLQSTLGNYYTTVEKGRRATMEGIHDLKRMLIEEVYMKDPRKSWFKKP